MFLREFTQEGISDAAVQFHRELNPKLWQGSILKPLVRYKLLEIAKHFIQFIDIPQLHLQDITISGSNAAYSYTELSDIDLHIIVNVPKDLEKILKPLYDAKKNQYNFIHEIKIKDIDVELYVQNSEDKHHSLGVYSVLDNKWIQEPTMGTVKINDSDVQAKVDNYLNKIMQALVDDELTNVQGVMQNLKKLRQAGLESGGEFSIENIAFKVLRAKGFIDQLRRHAQKLQDKELSLGEQKMKVKDITEDCWDGYKRLGMKKKGNKMVPNCVPKESNINEAKPGYNVPPDTPCSSCKTPYKDHFRFDNQGNIQSTMIRGMCGSPQHFGLKETDYTSEERKFGIHGSEVLALKVFRQNPDLSTSGRADELQDAGWAILAQEYGKKRANYMFNYDEDFPSDFVSDYDWLQKNGIPQGVDEVFGRRSSYGYNPDRDAERDWDAARRADQDFRNRERNAGDDGEDYYRQQMDKDRGPWYLKINGKIFKQKGIPKSFDWKKGATKYGLAILKNNPGAKIMLTRKAEDDTETVSEAKTTIKVPVTQKPRQGPLKPQTGAGKHKDKKKDAKQGKEKHKKPMYEAGTLKVQKDDDAATVLLNPATGVQTQIDKKNPNAPRLTQDEQGKLKLTMPQGAQSGDSGAEKQPNLVGKDVAIDTTPVEDAHRISASPVQPGGEITDVNTRSPIGGDQEHDEISKLLNQRLRKLAGI